MNEVSFLKSVVLFYIILFFFASTSVSQASTFSGSVNPYGQPYSESSGFCHRKMSFQNIDIDRQPKISELKDPSGFVNFGGNSPCELIDRAWLAYDLRTLTQFLESIYD